MKTATDDAGAPAPDAAADPFAGRSPFSVDREKLYAIVFHDKKPGLARVLKAWLWHFELHCVAVYRLGQFARRLSARSALLGLPVFAVYGVLQWLTRLVHKVDVSYRATIGPGFHLGHPSTIFIGPARIGSNCSVTHNVTIGYGLGTLGGFPTIGDRVWIGPGATITGAISIGDGATIAAGAVVSTNVPAGVLVGGNPSRVAIARYDNRALLGYPEVVGVDIPEPGAAARMQPGQVGRTAPAEGAAPPGG